MTIKMFMTALQYYIIAVCAAATAIAAVAITCDVIMGIDVVRV